VKYPKTSVDKENKSILIRFKKGKMFESEVKEYQNVYFFIEKDKNGDVIALKILEWR